MKDIFVFGSNLAGRHGAGSALHALNNYGAILGCGIGLQGNSYAIPTKDEYLRVLSLSEIQKYVQEFMEFAKDNYNMQFNIVAIGCGLAGYRSEQIAPMFKNVSDNCMLPKEFTQELNHG